MRVINGTRKKTQHNNMNVMISWIGECFTFATVSYMKCVQCMRCECDRRHDDTGAGYVLVVDQLSVLTVAHAALIQHAHFFSFLWLSLSFSSLELFHGIVACVRKHLTVTIKMARESAMHFIIWHSNALIKVDQLVGRRLVHSHHFIKWTKVYTHFLCVYVLIKTMDLRLLTW